MTVAQLDYSGQCTPNVGGQSDFANDIEHDFVALEGGWGSGKTWVGARKLLGLHCFNAFDSTGSPTFVASAIIAPTYRSALDYCVPEIDKACEELQIEVIWIPSKMRFIFPSLSLGKHTSDILGRTADAPDRIAGWEVGAAWGDEVARWKEDYDNPRGDPYIQLLGRVRAPKARLLQRIFTYTNEGDSTRIYDEFHVGHKTHQLYRAPTKENPAVKEFFEQQSRLLTKELARQYLAGEALSLRGAKMYSAFDFDRNVDQRVHFVKGRPLQLSRDFNIAPGMHALLGQYFQEEDMFTTFDEIYAPRLSVRGVVSELSKRLKKLDTTDIEIQIFGDATGQSEWAGTGESCYRILRQGLDHIGCTYRMRVPSSNPLVVDRVNAMNVAFLDLTDVIHYRIHPRCTELISDFRKMKYDSKTGEVQQKDKKRSHSADAEGYRVYYLRPARIMREDVVGEAVGIASDV